MQKGWIATVQIVIPEKSSIKGEPDITSASHAADAFTAILSENLQATGAILDWQYLIMGGQFLSPTPTYYDQPYEEGSVFGRG